MSQQLINIGTAPNDGTGDQLRTSFDKCNQNFTELYTSGAGTTTEGVWNFNQTSTDTTTAPTSGRFRTNTGDAATATQFAIHRISINGIDRANTLRTQRSGDIIQLQDKNNADSWARFVLQSTPVDNTDWFQLNVTFNSGGGTAPGNNQEIIFNFSASGAGGGGNVSNVGTPTASQLAQWTDATHIQGINASSLGFAPLASPTFTGDPKAPTATAGDNDTSIATTAFVTSAISTAGGSYQPLDADLTSLAAAAATNAIYYRSAANTWGPITIGAGLTFTSGTLDAPLFGSAVKGEVPASGGGTANFLRADGIWSAPAGLAPLPTRQVFTSGSGTYTTPANVRQLELTLVGAGGGGTGAGGGSTAGTAGTATTFGAGPIYSAGGGGGGAAAAAGGAGGTVSGSGTPWLSYPGASGGPGGANGTAAIG